MSRLEIPITGKMLWYTGDIRLWADIDLLLKDGAGRWRKKTFRVDTGTQITTFSAYEAKRLGLPMPQQVSRGATHVQTGLEVRSGVLCLRIDGMDQTEYVVPCLFLGDPDAPPDPSRAATWPRKLLQPFQLLDQLRFTIEKDPAAGLPYGEMVVEKR
jgi:hypothetical protein